MSGDLSQCDDIELFHRLSSDPAISRGAFEELYNRYAPNVYRYCLRVVGDEQLAQDLFQETFLNLHRSARQERTMTNVQAFILRIARNLCLNAKRDKRNTMLSLEDSDAPMQAMQETLYERTELEQLVLRALQCLRDEYREAIVLREYDGLSYAEIAEVVDVSVATVRIRIFRAKRSLARILAPYMGELFE